MEEKNISILSEENKKKLIDNGKTKGKLTYSEVFDMLDIEGEDFDSETVDKIYSMLEAEGIKVVSDAEAVVIESNDSSSDAQLVGVDSISHRGNLYWYMG